MLINSTSGTVQIALGMLRSAQVRVENATLGMNIKRDGSHDPELLAEIKKAKLEQRIAMQMLKMEDENQSHVIDMIA